MKFMFEELGYIILKSIIFKRKILVFYNNFFQQGKMRFICESMEFFWSKK